MKKIALDVDGVLLDFFPAFDAAASIVLNREVVAKKDEFGMEYYDFERRLGEPIEIARSILAYMQAAGIYGALEPFQGAAEAVRRIQEAGFQTFVVTAIPEKAKEMRLLNLKNKLDFEPDGIFCVGMGESKSDVIRNLSPDVYIDDRTDYLAGAPFVYHLGLIDQKETQTEADFQFDSHAHSILEWTELFLPTVSKNLDDHYRDNFPLQINMKLESFNRKHRLK